MESQTSAGQINARTANLAGCGHSPESCPGPEIDSQNLADYLLWLKS